MPRTETTLCRYECDGCGETEEGSAEVPPARRWLELRLSEYGLLARSGAVTIVNLGTRELVANPELRARLFCPDCATVFLDFLDFLEGGPRAMVDLLSEHRDRLAES